MTLDEIKNYLRIDGSLDDSLLSSLQSAAESYIKNSIEVDDVEDERFNLAVLLLVGHWYKNREATTSQNLQSIPLGVLSMIQQLRGLPPTKGDDSNG